MRVLTLSALLACACAAPSAPFLAYAPIIPAAIPTLSPGDLQGAAIDAKVKAVDEARAFYDQARLAADVARDQAQLALEDQKLQVEAADAKTKADQAILSAEQQRIISPGVQGEPAWENQKIQVEAADAKVKADDQAILLADQARYIADVTRDQAELEKQKEKVEEDNSIAKAKSEELFWNVEDKKWQAIDAVKTFEAKLDGAVASNADALVKSLAIPLVAPISLPYANLVYAPGLIPFTGIKDEKLIKTAEPEKETKDKLEQPKMEGLAIAQQHLNLFGAPWIQAPIALYQPGVLQPVLTPFYKQW